MRSPVLSSLCAYGYQHQHGPLSLCILCTLFFPSSLPLLPCCPFPPSFFYTFSSPSLLHPCHSSCRPSALSSPFFISPLPLLLSLLHLSFESSSFSLYFPSAPLLHLMSTVLPFHPFPSSLTPPPTSLGPPPQPQAAVFTMRRAGVWVACVLWMHQW